MLHCGNQVTEEGEVQILEAIMTDEQISFCTLLPLSSLNINIKLPNWYLTALVNVK